MRDIPHGITSTRHGLPLARFYFCTTAFIYAHTCTFTRAFDLFIQ